MLDSHYRDLGEIVLPVWQGRQHYMHTFDTDTFIMYEGYEDYQEPVRLLCMNASFSGVAHMTVDEKIIQPGWSHRRPGAHVDGRFLVEAMRWGHPGPGPNWAHYCNQIPTDGQAIDRMAVIVAADVPGCIAYAGQFDGFPKEDGDLEHIRDQLGTGEMLPANRGFWLSPDCVHESVIFQQLTPRIFLRLALES